MDPGETKVWVPPRVSFGPIPAPRYNATTWVEKDRYFFVYGGIVSDPEPHERDVVYRLDTRALFVPSCPRHLPLTAACSLGIALSLGE